MGGENSGRRPNPETIARKMEGVHEPKFFVPALGLGGVKPEALRSSPVDITGGSGGGHTIQDEGSNLTARSKLNFSGNGVLAFDDAGNDATIVSIATSGSETDPIYLALSGNHAAALGADDNYVTDAQLVVIGNTSGTNTGDQTSIVGITGTKAQFDTAVTDGNIAYATGAFHDGFSDFVANEHIDWTSTSSNLFTTGKLSGNTAVIGTLSGNAIRTLEDHSTSGNSAVVGIITHTSATPPTASNFPIGTIYIQYTA